MSLLKSIALGVILLMASSTGYGQINDSLLTNAGFSVKSKLKPYKKSDDLVLKVKIKNTTLEASNLSFQVFLYINGVAESTSKQKDVCLRPNKRVKYKFLFEPKTTGEKNIEFKNVSITKVESCEAADE